MLLHVELCKYLQLPSGESFVIQYGDKIYKLPIHIKEFTRLLDLFYTYNNMDEIELPSKFIFPKDMMKRLDHLFFVFPACAYNPIDKTDARRIMRSVNDRSRWLKGVVEAIEELHEHKMAHLDIRLANICYGHDWQPLLIDIDQSVNENQQDEDFFRSLSSSYGYSDMYTIAGDAPTIYKLDFKQLAIMLLDLISDSGMEEYDYNIKPPNLESANQFLKDLYNGEFKKDLFDQFLESTI